MMNETVKTALSVTSTAPGNVEVTGQSRAVGRIYTRLESGDFGILGACHHLALTRSESPIVRIEMVQSGQGFGFAYVNINGDECPRVLVCGLVHYGFDLPEPFPPMDGGAIFVRRCGYVETTHSLEDIFGPIVANHDEIDFAAIRPGWSLDVAAILNGAAVAGNPDPIESPWMDFQPEDN